MYLWKLAQLNVVTPHRDELRSVVVAASTEAQARAVAATVAGDEGRDAWINGHENGRTHCLAIGDASPEMFPYPGVVCADFLEA